MVLCIIHYPAASGSTAHSTLVLWLPAALHIVHWVRRTVVQLPVAMYYNCTHANTFPGHGNTLIVTPNLLMYIDSISFGNVMIISRFTFRPL